MPEDTHVELLISKSEPDLEKKLKKQREKERKVVSEARRRAKK